MNMRWFSAVLVLPFLGSSLWAQDKVGIFEDHQDVGSVVHSGSAVFDPAKRVYTLRGSGENMWSTQDAFQFAWTKVSGDVEVAADIAFPNPSGNPHKKAVLMFRQSLDADSPYVDVALHGNGLTALQYREAKGSTTREVQSRVNNRRHLVIEAGGNRMELDATAGRLRLTRRGNYVYLSLGEPLASATTPDAYDGESIRVSLEGDFYVGIGVCAHDPNSVAEANFSNLELRNLSAPAGTPVLYSTLETIAVSSTDRTAVYVAPGRFEAPNWSRDGSYILFNREGRLEKLPVEGGKLQVVSAGSADHLNNDHGISPDGTQLAISDNSKETNSATGAHDSLVYIVPISGGNPRQITQNAPSYWHGWSPDQKTLAFVGERNGEFDIYTIPAAGGKETQLTTAKGLDDGPEYSPDGQYIYFNSERTGHMQIWRMKPDGSDQEQVFSDDYNNWFPHLSPDGKWMVFLTYDKDVAGHPPNKDVMLRLMSLEDKKISILAGLFGGQGTINVPSWSPDGKQLAFVSYQLIAPEDAAQVAPR